VVIRSRTMEPCPPAVGTYKSLRQGHQRHIERGLVTRTRARPFKYSGSRPPSSRRRRRRAGSPGRGRWMSRTAARCSSKRSSSIPPGSTIRIEVVKCHRGRRDGLRKGSGKYSVEFPLSLVDGFMGPPSIFYWFSWENSRRNPCKCKQHAHGDAAAWSATARSSGRS
jgi:hypothetical protein